MTEEEIIQPQENPEETPVRTEPIYVDRVDTVATIVFNQPSKHNAISFEMWKQIPEIINALSDDDTLRCVVLRGAGKEAFSSGCDISDFAETRANRQLGITYGNAMKNAIEALYNCRHPMVAEVHGLCMGAGVELLSTCDIRICGESSTFGIPANHLGLVLSYPELEPIYHLIGSGPLMEMLLEGRTFSATDAKNINLVSRVVPDEMIAEETEKSVMRIIRGAPLTARWHKKFIRRLANPNPITPEENNECFDCYDTEDYRIGCAAFLLKDHPLFKGK